MRQFCNRCNKDTTNSGSFIFDINHNHIQTVVLIFCPECYDNNNKVEIHKYVSDWEDKIDRVIDNINKLQQGRG